MTNTQIRQIFGCGNNVPIIKERGESYPPFIVNDKIVRGWQTKTGIRIRHPGAYSKKGWSNMYYKCDPRIIYVGQYFS